ncbi:hypothetical protein TNIN_433081 [Trichonephila inaurata madagascariensis]|uniref:Uncharacterized protein n=1 Tax=Trichonephila inaurata madagascariensis TaxID=2747483 RepID=A0A8X6YRX5_9ARAC|nr:hypothetical protein TNIN_433081 [Trichonephila inaurata madagascariensis]
MPENPGSEVNENNPPPQIRNSNTEPKNPTNQSTAQAQLPPPAMLLVEKNYKAQMAAITKELRLILDLAFGLSFLACSSEVVFFCAPQD